MLKPLTPSTSFHGFVIILLVLISSHCAEAHRSERHDMARHSNFLTSSYGRYGGYIARRSKVVLSCAHNASVCGDLMAREGVGNAWGVCCGGKACKDIREDPYHCGGCGRACGYGLSCCEGACVDLNMDSHNCGHCGSHCPFQEQCSFGMCDYAGVTISPPPPTRGPKHR